MTDATDITEAHQALRMEIASAWNVLEASSFPPEMMGWPFQNVEGQLPAAIAAALDCLIRTANDLRRERDQAVKDREHMLRGMVAGAHFMGTLAAQLKLDGDGKRDPEYP